VEFVETFTRRRDEFKFSLIIHTAVGVDEANLKLGSVDARTAELNRKWVTRGDSKSFANQRLTRGPGWKSCCRCSRN